MLAAGVLLAGTVPARAFSSREMAERARQALPAEEGVVYQPLRPPTPWNAPGPVEWSARRLSPPGASTAAVRLEAWMEGRRVRSWLVGFRVLRVRPCVVAARPLPRGAVLDPSMVRVERRPLLPGRRVVGDPAEVAGSRTRRALEPGQVIERRDLEAAPRIARGEAVTVECRREGVVLRLAACARERGFAGKPFRVRSAQGRVLTVWLHRDGRITLSPPGGDSRAGPTSPADKSQEPGLAAGRSPERRKR